MRFFLVALMSLVLSACGDKAPQGAATSKSSGNVPMPAFGGDDAVAAVRESAGTPVAQLRFVIDTRPEVGKPFRVQLIASSVVAIAPLSVTVESTTLRVDPSTVAMVLVESGSGTAHQYSANHDLSVLTQQEGIAELTVRLVMDADTPETVYTIPVLVAKAGTDAGAKVPASDKPDPAAKGNNAQPQKG